MGFPLAGPFGGSSVVLVGMNFAVAKRWNENRIEKKKRYWNMNFCEGAIFTLGGVLTMAVHGQRKTNRDVRLERYMRLQKMGLSILLDFQRGRWL